MEEYIWLLKRVNRYETAWSVVASLFVHVLFLLVITSTNHYYSLSGNVAQFDVLWISPFSSPAISQTLPPAAAPEAIGSPEFRSGSRGSDPPTQPGDEEHEKPSSDPFDDQAVSAKQPSRRVTTTAPQETAVNTPENKIEYEAPETDESPAMPEAPTPLAEPERLHENIMQAANVSGKTVASERAMEEATGEKVEQGRTVKEKTGPERTVEKTAKPEQPAKENPAQARMAPEQERMAVATRANVPATELSPVRSAQASLVTKPLIREPAGLVPKPSEAPPEAKASVVPSVYGDLKLVMEGEGEVKLTVLFRNFAISRRNRALTRTEARGVKKLTPLHVKAPKQANEVIIESAREGIYIFTAETETVQSAKMKFTLKVFEDTPRGKTKHLGTKTISGKAVIARIMMPEGILWEDESAFTGSIKDSSSITKFNTDTGVTWKEYVD